MNDTSVDHRTDDPDLDIDIDSESAWADDEFAESPRRRGPGLLTTLLLVALVAAAGFTAGVVAQKQTADSAAAGGLPPFLQGGALPPGLTPPGGGGGTATTANTPALVGTVVAVDGDTVTVQDLGGNQFQVLTTPDTTVTLSSPITTDTLANGQNVQVRGTKKSDGTVDATAITAR